MYFSELYKIMVNKVTFVGYMGANAPIAIPLGPPLGPANVFAVDFKFVVTEKMLFV